MKRLTYCLSAIAIGSAAGLIHALESPYSPKSTSPSEPPVLVAVEKSTPPEKTKKKEKAEKPSHVERAFFVEENAPKTASGLPPVTSSVIQASAKADEDDEPAKAAKPVEEKLGKPMPGQEVVYVHAPSRVHIDHTPACEERWMAGLGFYYIQPRWKVDPSFGIGLGGVVGLEGDGFYVEESELYIPLGPLGVEADSDSSILRNSFDYEVAPRVVLGYAFGDGAGVRAAFWGLQSDARSNLNIDFTLEDEEEGDSIDLDIDLNLRSRLELYVLDVEGTKECQKGRWSSLISYGLRYAELKQRYRFDADVSFVRVDGGVEEENFDATLDLTHHSRFRGLGPTAAIELRRQLGCRGLALYGSLRGTVLVGQHSQRNTFNFVLDQEEGDDINLNISQTSSRDDVMPVGEIECGFEYTRCMSYDRVFFLQAALVSQCWSDAGSTFDVLDGLLTIGASGDLDLFGLKVTSGIVW